MRVLVACETSGVVRDAFLAHGHQALSCDLLPTEVDGPHYQGDVRDVLHACWDLMIAHPDCSALAVSGALHFAGKWHDGRQAKAQAFFMQLMLAPIPRICIENPVCVMSTLYRPPDQIIQPYDFGEDASKKTCLWLVNLPKLVPTGRVPGRRVEAGGRVVERWANQCDSGQNKLGPSEDRWLKRSRTYAGIAQAMAQQWGNQPVACFSETKTSLQPVFSEAPR